MGPVLGESFRALEELDQHHPGEESAEVSPESDAALLCGDDAGDTAEELHTKPQDRLTRMKRYDDGPYPRALMNAEFTDLSDETLAYVVQQYELRIAAVRFTTGAAAQALRREFTQKGDAALADRERRRT